MTRRRIWGPCPKCGSWEVVFTVFGDPDTDAGFTVCNDCGCEEVFGGAPALSGTVGGGEDGVQHG